MDKIFKSKQITNGVAELALENIISTPSFVMNGVGSHPTVYNGDIPANSHDGVSGAEELILGTSCKSIGDSAFAYCTSLTGNLVIPDSVTLLDSICFNSCTGLTGDLYIPDSVTNIQNGVFGGCSGLTGTLTIGSGVTFIGASAFQSCTNITRVDCYVEKSILDQPAILMGSGVLQIHVRSTDTTWLSSGAPDNEGLQTIGSLSGIEVFKDL